MRSGPFILAAGVACTSVAIGAGDVHAIAERASALQPANRTHTAVEIGNTIVGVYAIPGEGSNGAVGTLQPGAGSTDEATGRTTADTQINLPPYGHFTTATSNAGHDAPSVIYPGDGSVLVAYGAASTYAAYHPPQAWGCLRDQFCEPYKRASATGDPVPALARAQEQLLPSSGLSEMSYATLGDATIMAGQQQTSAPSGEAGAQGYVTYRAGGHFETAADGDGLYTITTTPNDDGYFEFAVSSASGSGTIALSIDGTPCTLAGLPATDGAGAAQAFVQFANAQCAAFRSRFIATVARYAPAEARFGGATVGVALRSGDVRSLPPVSEVHLSCTGGITCVSASGPQSVYDVRRSGLHRHFLFGGVTRAGEYIYDIMDLEQVTGSWFGSEENSYGLALACFRTRRVDGSVWTWTDCGGSHPFALRPGEPPAERLQPGSPYLIRPPRGGFSQSMTPFATAWSMRAQAPVSPRHEPVIASESATGMPGGDLLVAYGCQSSEGNDAICYVQLDARGDTVRAGIVDEGSEGGSLPSLDVTTLANGEVVLGALVGIASRWDCGSTGACFQIYRLDPHSGMWSRISSRPLGGANDIGFPGTVSRGNDAFIVLYKDLLDRTHARILTFSQSLR